MKRIEQITKEIGVDINIDPIDFMICYCNCQEIKLSEFIINNKKTEFTRDRAIACYILYKTSKCTLTEISKIMNRTDHSSIVRYIKWVIQEFKNKVGFRKEFKKITEKLCLELQK